MDYNKQIVVLLNGPPKSGKDYIARHYQKLIDECPLFHPAAPMREHVERIIGFEMDEAWYNAMKDEPMEELRGHTIRECMIDFSENYLKPRYGNGIITKLMMEAMKEMAAYRRRRCRVQLPFIVASLGFTAEVQTLIESGYVKTENILLVKVSRRNCTFDGDSRHYVDRDKFPEIGFLHLHNNGAIEGAVHMLAGKIEQMQSVNF